MAQGGIGLLAQTADDAEDPQTLRMVAGAIANLCGNGTYDWQFQYLFFVLNNIVAECEQKEGMDLQ